MYFANDDGMLTYNGSHWETYFTTDRSNFRSLAIGNDGLVYGGGQNEIGVFKPNQSGLWTFSSLKEYIPEKHREFEDVWGTINLDGTIYFRASNKVYIFKNQSFKVLDGIKADFFGIAQGKIIVQDLNQGLFFIENEEYVAIKNSQQLVNQLIDDISHIGNITYIATKNSGIYRFIGQEISYWDCPASDFAKKNTVRSFISLDNNRISIGSIYNGLAIADQEGKIIHTINKEDGLLSNSILCQYIDRNQNLWLGLDKGINYLDIHSPFTRIIPDGELEGAGYTAKIFKGSLYLGTNNGLYQMPLDSGDDFSLIQGTKGQTWGLDIINQQLILSHDEGAFIIKEKQTQTIEKGRGYWLFRKTNDDSIIAGTYDGLRHSNGSNWQSLEQFSELMESSRFMEFDNKGNIWVSHPYKGIYKISSGKNGTETTLEYLGKEDGLPSNLNNHVFKIRDQLIFCGEKGIFSYNYDNGRFEANKAYNDIFGTETNVRRIVETPSGNIWFVTQNEIGLLEINDAGFEKTVKKQVFPHLKDLLNGNFEFIYPYSDELVFIGTEQGFIRYSPRNVSKEDTSFNVVLHNVSITSNGNHSLFDGNWFENQKIQHNAIRTSEHSHHDNAFAFSYSATSFAQSHLLQYQHKLEGFEDGWSEWSTHNVKEYTNLPPGNYTFLVQAKNHLGQLSNISNYEFSINPPWYKTSLAYLVYFLLTSFILYSLYKRMTRKYRYMEQDHEKIVQQNQEEINRLKSEKMKLELEHKKRALVSSTLLLVQKNETLAELKEDLSSIKKETSDKKAVPRINKLIHKLQQDEILDDGWEQFMLHFNELHGDFLKRLKGEYIDLTPKDLKLCGYLRMNLSTKEIASLMNVSIRGVEASRYRLRKKMNLDSNQNLTEFLMVY